MRPTTNCSIMKTKTIKLTDSELEEEEDLYDHDDEDEASYIEIALEPGLSLPPLSLRKEEEVEQEDEKTDKEIELRISLSSSKFSFPVFSSSSSHTLCSSTTNSTAFCSSKCSTDDGDSPSPSPAGAQGSKPSGLSRNQSSNKWKVQIPTLHRFYNVLLSALNPKPSSKVRNDDHNQQFGSGSKQLVRSRKTSKAISGMNGGGTKFFIKFQSLSIQSALASFWKPQKTISSCEGSRKSSKAISLKSYRRLMIKPFQSTDRNIDRQRSSSSCRRGERRRAMEINGNFDGILKGMLGSLGANRRSGRSRGKQTKSCPSSLGSSPLHESESSSRSRIYARENSIQAAISHCKKSLGQTP